MIGYGCGLSDFFSLEPREIIKVLDVLSNKAKTEHRLQYISVVNAIGACFGGKDFDYIDVFESSNETNVNNETYTDEEVEFLRNNF
jgi:hypothetical protein